MNWLQKMETEERIAWEEMMIDHAFDADEWQAAHAHLLALLAKDRKTASEPDLRSYLSCCAESVGSLHPLPDLRTLVDELYQAYGMESAADAQP